MLPTLLLFSQGLTWFSLTSPGSIFTLRPLNIDDAFLRGEIVLGAIVAAYGMLVWRSASRKLSIANCVIVLSRVTASRHFFRRKAESQACSSAS